MQKRTQAVSTLLLAALSMSSAQTAWGADETQKASEGDSFIGLSSQVNCLGFQVNLYSCMGHAAGATAGARVAWNLHRKSVQANKNALGDAQVELSKTTAQAGDKTFPSAGQQVTRAYETYSGPSYNPTVGKFNTEITSIQDKINSNEILISKDDDVHSPGDKQRMREENKKLEARKSELQGKRDSYVSRRFSNVRIAGRGAKGGGAGMALVLAAALEAERADLLKKKRACIGSKDAPETLMNAIFIEGDCKISFDLEGYQLLSNYTEGEVVELLKKYPKLQVPYEAMKTRIQNELSAKAKVTGLDCKDPNRTKVTVDFGGQPMNFVIDNVQRLDGKKTVIRGALVAGEAVPEGGVDNLSYEVGIDEHGNLQNLNSKNGDLAGPLHPNQQNALATIVQYNMHPKALTNADIPAIKGSTIGSYKLRAAVGQQMTAIQRAFPDLVEQTLAKCPANAKAYGNPETQPRAGGDSEETGAIQ